MRLDSWTNWPRSSIEQQAILISAHRRRGTGRRLLEANADEDAIIRHYRRIEALFRRLQVCGLIILHIKNFIRHKVDANLSSWSIANEHLAVRPRPGSLHDILTASTEYSTRRPYTCKACDLRLRTFDRDQSTDLHRRN